MEVRLEGDRIAGLRSQSGGLISLYAQRPSPGGFSALLIDLLKPIRRRAERRGRELAKAVMRDVQRIRLLAPEFEADSAPAYAVFASEADSIFAQESLGHAAPSFATIGPRPYMRPLRAAPRIMRGAVLVADHNHARTFVSRGGFVEELGSQLEADPGNRSWGGFSGYEEHNVRAHADETTSKLWRKAGARLLAHHLEKRFDYLAVGCREPDTEELGRSLHPYLARLQRVTFVAAPRTVAIHELRAQAPSFEADLRRDRQSALAGRVCDTGWSGGNAVLGLSHVLSAVNRQAIDTLVVAGPFTRSGALCNACGHLSRLPGDCPVCGRTMFEVDDVVGAAMDATVGAGGSVSQIEVASPLDTEGVGALTRFPVVA